MNIVSYQDPAIYVISAIYDVSLLLVDATIYNKRPLPLFNVAKYENSRHKRVSTNDHSCNNLRK